MLPLHSCSCHALIVARSYPPQLGEGIAKLVDTHPHDFESAPEAKMKVAMTHGPECYSGSPGSRKGRSLNVIWSSPALSLQNLGMSTSMTQPARACSAMMPGTMQAPQRT